MPRLAVVVSTIGRPQALERLLESIDADDMAPDCEVVVVDQSEAQQSAALAGGRPWRMAVTTARSARGASRGRNVGLRLTSAPVVAFPDDDAWYPAGTLAAVAGRFERETGLAALCGRQVTVDGRSSMGRWKAQACTVTAYNFLQTSIMSTMFFRRSVLDGVGEFDEDMGVGSSGWYGAGEESDLLLRVVEAGAVVPYDPELLVLQDDPRDVVDDDFVEKMLRYGCGQGHLWRKRRLPLPMLAYYCGRKLPAAAVRAARGQRVLARADLAWVRGNIAGLRDVPPRGLRRP